MMQTLARRQFWSLYVCSCLLVFAVVQQLELADFAALELRISRSISASPDACRSDRSRRIWKQQLKYGEQW